MIRYENNCVCCPSEMGCLGSWCPHRNVEVHYCDECGDELDDIYNVDGEELCEHCLKRRFKVV